MYRQWRGAQDTGKSVKTGGGGEGRGVLKLPPLHSQQSSKGYDYYSLLTWL
jgi:hypothetical protein